MNKNMFDQKEFNKGFEDLGMRTDYCGNGIWVIDIDVMVFGLWLKNWEELLYLSEGCNFIP